MAAEAAALAAAAVTASSSSSSPSSPSSSSVSLSNPLVGLILRCRAMVEAYSWRQRAERGKVDDVSMHEDKLPVTWKWVFGAVACLLDKYKGGLTRAILETELTKAWDEYRRDPSREASSLTVDWLLGTLSAAAVSEGGVFFMPEAEVVDVRAVKLVSGLPVRLHVQDPDPKREPWVRVFHNRSSELHVILPERLRQLFLPECGSAHFRNVVSEVRIKMTGCCLRPAPSDAEQVCFVPPTHVVLRADSEGHRQILRRLVQADVAFRFDVGEVERVRGSDWVLVHSVPVPHRQNLGGAPVRVSMKIPQMYARTADLLSAGDELVIQLGPGHGQPGEEIAARVNAAGSNVEFTYGVLDVIHVLSSPSEQVAPRARLSASNAKHTMRASNVLGMIAVRKHVEGVNMMGVVLSSWFVSQGVLDMKVGDESGALALRLQGDAAEAAKAWQYGDLVVLRNASIQVDEQTRFRVTISDPSMVQLASPLILSLLESPTLVSATPLRDMIHNPACVSHWVSRVTIAGWESHGPIMQLVHAACQRVIADDDQACPQCHAPVNGHTEHTLSRGVTLYLENGEDVVHAHVQPHVLARLLGGRGVVRERLQRLRCREVTVWLTKTVSQGDVTYSVQEYTEVNVRHQLIQEIAQADACT